MRQVHWVSVVKSSLKGSVAGLGFRERTLECRFQGLAEQLLVFHG